MKKNFVHDEHGQSFYNAFNEFIFSSDQKLFNKLISKYRFAQQTSFVPGAIVELGVFKGSGMAAWLKTLRMLGLNREVYGFDIFDKDKLKDSISTSDSELMQSLFSGRGFEPHGYADVLQALLERSGHLNFKLVSGDIFDTLPLFLDENPGFRAAIVNFDLDTSEPTLFALEQLWPRLVSGGVALFDEYGINEWTESNAVDEFVAREKLTLSYTNLVSPSAFIIK